MHIPNFKQNILILNYQCVIYAIAFDENPMTRVKVKHGGPALKELAKTLE